MENYRLLVSVTDIYGKWKLISSSIINEGPLCVLPDINIPQEDDFSCPFFSPEFITDESNDKSLCHIFVIPFDSKFAINDLKKIKEWRDNNPEKGLLTIVLSVAKSQWSFTTQRSKIEAKFHQFIENSDLVIGKYITDDGIISESDLKQFHLALQVSLKNAYQKHILSLQAIFRALDDQDQRYPEVSRNLANYYHMFGYFTASKLLNRIIISSETLPFWPKNPEFTDIRKLGPNFSCKSGLDVLGSSLNGIFKSSQNHLVLNELKNDFTWVFSKALQNCHNEKQEIFIRYWIYYNSTSFLDYVNTIEDENKVEIEQTFLIMILSQLSSISNSKVDLNDDFFKSIRTSSIPIKDKVSVNNYFNQYLKKSKEIFKDYHNHQILLDVYNFLLLLNKDDITNALKLVSTIIYGKDPNHEQNFLIESCVLEPLFNNCKTQSINIASLILTSNCNNEIKKQAFIYLSKFDIKLLQKFSVYPRINLSTFYKEHELFHTASFSILIKLPEWMIGFDGIIWIEFISGSNILQSEKREMKLENTINIKPTILCKLAGVFDKLYLYVQYKLYISCWNLPLKIPLIVKESTTPPIFDLKSPFLLNINQKHSSIFTTTIHDTSCVKLTYSFEMESLLEIQLLGENGEILQRSQPNEKIEITQFSAEIKIRLIYILKESPTISVICSILQKTGNVVNYKNHYDFPIFMPITVHLSQQTLKYHQFQLYNPFPESFRFNFNNKEHHLAPISTYYIIRELSDSPLQLTFYENGWDDYPVMITTSQFKLIKKDIQIEYDNQPWIVGQPKLIKLDPPATQIAEKSDLWIDAQQDPIGEYHFLIPTSPGRIKFPKFQYQQQIVECSPKFVEILPTSMPTYNVF